MKLAGHQQAVVAPRFNPVLFESKEGGPPAPEANGHLHPCSLSA